ncbi:MAG: lipid-A-disaccharide synthase N-terminal domain-containing protein [Planctomycetota bacterium]
MATVWLVIGFAGQVLLFGRWVVQWWSSERAKSPVIPLGYWYMSLAGGAALMAYAIHQADAVFIVGTTVGEVIYVRNLLLWRRAYKPPLAPDPAAAICPHCGATPPPPDAGEEAAPIG